MNVHQHSCPTRRHRRGAPACPSAGACTLSTLWNVGLLPLAFAFCTAVLVLLPSQALPLSCRVAVFLQWFFTRFMCVMDFLLYNPRRYMLSARKTVV